jgi:hypothetical protein
MTDAPAPRRRGGQPGNTNSLKHGFYARKLPRRDRADWQNYQFTGLKEETQMLRFVIRRLVELSDANQDLEKEISLLRVLSLALISLTRLLRTDQLLGASQFDNELQTALSEVLQNMQNDPDIFSPSLNLEPN